MSVKVFEDAGMEGYRLFRSNCPDDHWICRKDDVKLPVSIRKYCNYNYVAF